MHRRSRIAFGAFAVVMALLLSSCWQISKVRAKYWVISAAAGTKTAVVLDLIKANPDLTGTGYAFVVVGFDNTQLTNAGRQWDALGNFGGPLNGVKDDSLRDQLLAGAGCTVGGTSLADLAADFGHWNVFRTGNINFTGVTQDDVLKFKQYFRPASGAVTPLPGAFIMISGFWGDDGNGIVDAFELQCQSTFGGALYVDN